MTTKVLVVDDEPDIEPLVLQHFNKQIHDHQMDFVFAASGVEALKQLDIHKEISVILTDINMREMDGLTLLSKISKLNRPIKSIIVSAYGDIENIRSAMRKGACDFITKPIDFDELSKTIQSAIEELSSCIKPPTKSESGPLTTADQDHDIARIIQNSVVPNNFKPFPDKDNFEIYGTVLPSKEVGADFFDFFPIDNDHLAFIIADVTTKGISAALFMTMCRAIYRVVSMQLNSPKECMERLNRYLCEDNQRSMFLTAFAGVLNLKTGEIVYCNAGLNPPYYVTFTGIPKQIGREEGVALGVIESSKYVEGKITLKKNEFLLLYTNGMVESTNKQKEPYSTKLLEESLKKSFQLPSCKLLNQLIDDVKKFSESEELNDDITLLYLQYRQ